jgi:hypothetical protein
MKQQTKLFFIFFALMIGSIISANKMYAQQLADYRTKVAHGAKLRINKVTSEATVIVTGPGGYRRQYNIGRQDNNFNRTDFLTLIPVLSNFGWVYTVTIEVRNQKSSKPLVIYADLYSVDDDNIPWNKLGSAALIKDGVASYNGPGTVKKFSFTLQKL